MMKTWQKIKQWLSRGCVYFTVVSLILIMLQMLSNNSNLSEVKISVLSFLLILPFGLVMSLSQGLFSCAALPRPLQYLLHFVITVISLFVFLYLPANASMSPSTGLVMLALLSVLYWIFLGLAVWIRSRVRKLMQDD